jgi:hypothetical protein
MLRRFLNSLPIHQINFGQVGFDQRLARCLLETGLHLLLFGIASRQYLNLLHWLPLLIAFQQAVLRHDGRKDRELTGLNGERDVQEERGDMKGYTGMCRYSVVCE